jgi:hypothetical protein
MNKRQFRAHLSETLYSYLIHHDDDDSRWLQRAAYFYGGREQWEPVSALAADVCGWVTNFAPRGKVYGTLLSYVFEFLIDWNLVSELMLYNFFRRFHEVGGYWPGPWVGTILESPSKEIGDKHE